MQNVYVKLRQKEKENKYRKILSTDDSIYHPLSETVTSFSPYVPGAMLEDGEWFYVTEASKQVYTKDVLDKHYDNSVDFATLEEKDFSNIDFLVVSFDKDLFFQNVSKSKLVSRKSILYLGKNFEYHSTFNNIAINELPDAIYHRERDRLYFRRLEAITSIFKGIDQLYKEATMEETEQFLKSDFIELEEGYSSDKVKTANRKRIALAQKTLSTLNADDKKNIFKYIQEYCPNLKKSEKTFRIGSENELKLLLYGIEQRFYTTPVGGEQRIANSVIPLSQGGRD